MFGTTEGLEDRVETRVGACQSLAHYAVPSLGDRWPIRMQGIHTIPDLEARATFDLQITGRCDCRTYIITTCCHNNLLYNYSDDFMAGIANHKWALMWTKRHWNLFSPEYIPFASESAPALLEWNRPSLWPVWCKLSFTSGMCMAWLYNVYSNCFAWATPIHLTKWLL